MWKDHFGRTCEEKESFCQKVSVDVDCPDYFLVADKVGGNISKKRRWQSRGNFASVRKRVSAKKSSKQSR